MFSLINPVNPYLVGVSLNTILLIVAWITPKKLLTNAGLLHGKSLRYLVPESVRSYIAAENLYANSGEEN